MKAWFEFTYSYLFKEENLYLGFGYYKHGEHHNWKGFTIQFFLFQWVFVFNYVNNYKEYDKRINWHRYRGNK